MGFGRGLSGGLTCIKYLMFSFNLLFWLIGMSLTAFGIWVLVDDRFKELAVDTSFAVLQYSGIGMMAVGCIIMVVGFFGCCGAIRESRCLLSVFFIFMFILFGGLIAAGVLCIINKDFLIERISSEYKSQVMSYDEESSDLVNLIQEVLQCCGADNFVIEYRSFTQLNDRLPKTCPHLKTNSRQTPAGTPSCTSEAESLFQEYGTALGAVLLGTGGVMLIGMVFSMLLCCTIRETFE